MKEVLKNAKNIIYIKYKENIYRPNERKIYYNSNLIKFYRNLGSKYILIKKEILKNQIL